MRTNLQLGSHPAAPRVDLKRLRQLLAQERPLPLPVASGLVVQLCAELAKAHASGVVHGGITPEHVVVRSLEDGRLRASLLGFGDPDAFAHAPAYASPERLRASSDIDGRADIWSIGAILYELVTGQRAFAGRTVEEAQLAAARGPAWPMQDAPASFEAIVRRCLMLDRAARFARAEHLSNALAPFLLVHATVVGVAGLAVPALAPERAPADSVATIVCAPPEEMDSDTGPRTERSGPPVHRGSERTFVAAPDLARPERPGPAMPRHDATTDMRSTMVIDAPGHRVLSIPRPNVTVPPLNVTISRPVVAVPRPIGAVPAPVAPPVAPPASGPASSPFALGEATGVSGAMGGLVSDAPLVTKVLPRRGYRLLRALLPAALIAVTVAVKLARGDTIVPSATSAPPPPPASVAPAARLAPLPPPEAGLLPPARPATSSSGVASAKASPRVVPALRRPVPVAAH